MLTGIALADTVNFDNLTTGAPPPGWTATKTGTGAAKWTIRKDDTAPRKPNVLKVRPAIRFASKMTRASRTVCGSSVQAHFRERTSGRRSDLEAKDPDNYYVARANALKDNVTIYHRINDRRTEVQVASNQWHTLRVDFQGNHFVVTFDGKKSIEWDDSSFADAGKLGVWTKADSATLFDDFTYVAK